MKGCVGIDEVGRGPLAGPVTVCAVQWIDLSDPKVVLEGISDSKKLSPSQRRVWLHRAEHMSGVRLRFALYSVQASEIDRAGIVAALRDASAEALKNLKNEQVIHHVYADYGLPVSKQYVHTHLVKGDEKNPLIALASIIAKETRDALMCELSEQFPVYGFNKHKGYGTKYHREMIQKHGSSPVHRKTFLKNIVR